ncbi:MAG TPA: phosphatidylserine/phosphatidylglycerophosphate/cardiolipin synthase family protein [Parachlamydiaceae bacterium]|nr:phosphatidylserine/phosphatidylglycerophosphate/cardiolipin synthase family protein [Parachlamydiaceae bacterium]
MKRKRSPNIPLKLSPKRLKQYFMSFTLALICSIAFWVQEQQHEIRTVDENSPIELYANQISDDLGNTFSEAIDSAQKSVLLVVYSLTDKKIIDCLKKQSLNGLNVKVICDAKASPYVDSKLGDRVDITRRFGPGLMHQKILVVDEEKVWLGSANMTSESLNMHGNLVTALQSQQLASNIHSKAETLKVEGRGSSFNTENFMIGGQQIELWFLPDNLKAVQRLKSLIYSAKKTVRVAMFTWTRTDLAYAIIDAKKRGINAEVVIDRYSAKGASAKIVKLLKDNQINVTLSTGAPLLHHKFLYIDNTVLVNGSANWTKAAFTQNDDCFIVIHNLTDQQNMQMENLWKVILSESAAP